MLNMVSVQSQKLAHKMTGKLRHYVLNKFVAFYLLIKFGQKSFQT